MYVTMMKHLRELAETLCQGLSGRGALFESSFRCLRAAVVSYDRQEEVKTFGTLILTRVSILPTLYVMNVMKAVSCTIIPPSKKEQF